jgi:hypothetical protein
MKETNRVFISGRVEDIFRRMTLTAKDRDIILAMFRKALAGGPAKRGRLREATKRRKPTDRPFLKNPPKGESHGE